jgi:hypothetical protein
VTLAGLLRVTERSLIIDPLIAQDPDPEVTVIATRWPERAVTFSLVGDAANATGVATAITRETIVEMVARWRQRDLIFESIT